ncbi:MAG: acyltransferase family protein [Actinophytocola sp.]|nr:acyltransferase family protein [Actinophytocola sp.]
MNWDLLRVIAILAVVVGHITYRGPANQPELAGYPFAFTPWFGASTLMVVSGYFVCVTISRGHAGRWLGNRLARLLPAYIVAVLITYTVSRFAVLAFNGWDTEPGLLGTLFGDPILPPHPEPDAPPPWQLPTPADLVANLTVTQEWSDDVVFVDNSYWTLPVQVVAFVSAALLWRHKFGADRGRVLSRVLLLGPIVVLPLTLLPGEITDVLGAIYGGLGVGRAYLFGVGIALWLWARRELSHAELGLLATTAVVLHGASSEHPVPSAAGFAIMLGLIAAAARGPDWDVRVLCVLRRPVAWLAGISFGVYLVHQQLGFVLARVLAEHGVSGWPRLMLVFAAAILAGWAMTVLVERPAHRLLTRRRAVTPAAERLAPAAPDVLARRSVGAGQARRLSSEPRVGTETVGGRT